MDHRQIEQQSQERAQIASCDPLTVIAQAKQGLYKEGGGSPNPWLEEVVTRFEAQQRAALGSNASTFVGSGS